jgi:hypothetical protein
LQGEFRDFEGVREAFETADAGEFDGEGEFAMNPESTVGEAGIEGVGQLAERFGVGFFQAEGGWGLGTLQMKDAVGHFPEVNNHAVVFSRRA